jgi:hypothetical protein
MNDRPDPAANFPAYMAWLDAGNRCPFCELVIPCAHWDANGDEYGR